MHRARTAAVESGVAIYTKEFEDEAAAAKFQSTCWLIAAALFSTIAIAGSVSIALGLFGDVPTNSWDFAYRTSGRVMAIAVLFYAAVWTGRIALANLNLASVNRHRANSLKTLQKFRDGADDPATKDAVVLEGARSIYENVPTGFLARQPAQPGALARTVEVIKKANGQD